MGMQVRGHVARQGPPPPPPLPPSFPGATVMQFVPPISSSNMGSSRGNPGAGLSTRPSLMDSWPFSALQPRAGGAMSPQKSYYYPTAPPNVAMNHGVVLPDRIPDYPGTGAFKSPALGLSPRASVGRMTPASPYTRAPPAVAARQSQLFIRAQQHIQNHVRFKQPPHEPPPSHHQQASFNNNNKRRSLVEERRRMFELGVSPVAPPPQQRHALATIRPTPAGEGSAMAGNSLTFVPSILRTPRDAQNGPSMPQSGVVSGRGSMLTTPLKTAHFPAAQGHFYSRPSIPLPASVVSSKASGIGLKMPPSSVSVDAADDDRHYARAWQQMSPSVSDVTGATSGAMGSATSSARRRQQGRPGSASATASAGKQLSKRSSRMSPQQLHQHTVPLVGAWTINRWLSVLSDNSSTSFMVWSIYPYSLKKREHAGFPGRLLFSQTFTTTRGYRMRAMVALNGTGPYAGRYLSVFWQLMPSADDASLPWPMRDTVTVRVLPAGTNDAFSSTSVSGPIRNPKSFSRPEGNKPTPPWGFKKFINHNYLESGHFIQADTLWLAFEVTEVETLKLEKTGKDKQGGDLFGNLMRRFFYSSAN